MAVNSNGSKFHFLYRNHNYNLQDCDIAFVGEGLFIDNQN
jgi:hypothetical protein